MCNKKYVNRTKGNPKRPSKLEKQKKNMERKRTFTRLNTKRHHKHPGGWECNTKGTQGR